MNKWKRLLLVLAVLALPFTLGLVTGRIVTTYILFEDFNTYIRTDTANEIEFGVVGGEDFSLGFGTSNTLTLSSDSGVVTLALGDVDDVSGIGSLVGESSGVLSRFLWEVENVTANDVLTTAECGKWFIVDGNTVDVTLTLPSVGATEDGLWFVIADANAAAASDVSIAHADSDTINGSANDFASDGADDLGATVMIVYDHSNTNWECLVFQVGDCWDSD